MSTTHKRLAAAVKAADDTTEVINFFKKLSRKEDLATVKLLIKFHSFDPTDLFSDTETKRKRRAGGNAVKKVSATPRKVTAKAKKSTGK